uniref:Uncharacterized protein n=1 Tax=Anguilla anguilla TaxID=7936 RepID=A0A0E9PJD2_ANGAN
MLFRPNPLMNISKAARQLCFRDVQSLCSDQGRQALCKYS